MKNPKHFPKGSEWRKWDLHVHSFNTSLNNQFSGSNEKEKLENYLDEIEKFEDISVLGVTDYFSINGYLKLQEEKNKGRLDNIDLLLPNVELRVYPVTKDKRAINIHVIFDPEIVEELNYHFFPELKFSYKGNDYNCTKEGLERLGSEYKKSSKLNSNKSNYFFGIEQFKVNFNVLREVLNKEKSLEGHYLVAVSNNSKDGASGIKHSSLAAARQEIYRLANLIFSSNPTDRDYFLGLGEDEPDDVKNKYGSLKPCVHGSDAHSLKTIFKPDKERYTWIKADPTFKGLKQIIYEPEIRVNIGKDNPENNYPKNHFSKVKISGSVFEEETPKFIEKTLPLNSSMAGIIGGRGTGKSLLLDVIYSTFNKGSNNKTKSSISTDRLSRIKNPICEITMTNLDNNKTLYKYGDKQNYFDYLHVRQGDVKEIAEDPQKLSDAIKDLIGYKVDQDDENLEVEIKKTNREIDDIKEWFASKDENGNQIYSKDYNKEIIEKNKAFIKTITAKQIKDKIEEFTKNKKLISSILSFIDELKVLKLDLENFENDINERIRKILKNKLIEKKKMSLISLSQIEEIQNIISELEFKLEELKSENEQITTDLEQKDIKGEISGLLEKIDFYQENIDSCEAKINKIEEKKDQLKTLKKDQISFSEKIISLIYSNKNLIDRKYQEKVKRASEDSSGHERIIDELLKDIDIYGDIYFYKNFFHEGLKFFFDGRKIKRKSLDRLFPIKDYEDFFKLIRGDRIIDVDETDEKLTLQEFANESDLFIKEEREDFFSYFYSLSQIEKYLKVLPSIKYKGKVPEKLSVGQRGTFFVCLKLATQAFSAPFVFDQPEDDLDNEFIVNDLCPLFRKIKKYRQIIIVSHNANLIVNTDTEQIIVAKNEEETISFESGSLENPNIRDKICTILEGGEAAFCQRERRYGLPRIIR